MSFESNKYARYSTYCVLYSPEKHSWEQEIHTHTTEEILLITGRGSCTIISNGTSVDIQAPALVWNRIGSFHMVSRFDETMTIRILTFQPQIFSEMPQRFICTDFLQDNAFFALPLNDTNAERMLQLYNTLKSSPQFQRELLIPCIFHQVSLYLKSDVKPIRFGSTESYIFDVINLLQKLEADKITIPELANRFNVGTTKLKADFKRLTSQTIHNFQMQQRLRSAYHLLANTKMPLAQIAAHCGFTDESHLIRAFRKHSGMTPSTYRTTYQNRWVQ